MRRQAHEKVGVWMEDGSFHEAPHPICFEHGHCFLGGIGACLRCGVESLTACEHQSQITPDGHGSFCWVCGETLS